MTWQPVVETLLPSLAVGEGNRVCALATVLSQSRVTDERTDQWSNISL